MALENVAEQYFKNLNPIATRIHSDLNETRLLHEHLWTKLSQDEKEQILNESIIKPEVLSKYQSDKLTKNDERSTEIILDDNCSFRDEHAGPFSLRTKSQRNLITFQYEVNSSSKEKTNGATLKHVAQTPFFMQDFELGTTSNIDIESEACSNTKLPKTGLDFLDNW